jgi:hypothetical protein
VGEWLSTDAVRGVDCLTKHVASFDAAVATPQDRAEIGPCVGLLEAGVGAGEHLDRLTQQVLTARAPGHQPGGSQRDSEDAGGAEGAGQLQLLLTQPSRRVVFTESQFGERCVGAPRQVARAQGLGPNGDVASGPEVFERLIEPSLSEPEAAPGASQ